MDEFVEWIQDRGYYRDRIQFQREMPARTPVTRFCEMDPLITDHLADRGIDELYAHQYTGALSSHERQQARDEDPAIVLTTPDMLYCGLLICRL